MTVGEADFTGYTFRDVTVVRSDIVYFGSRNQKSTYILSQDEESKELALKSEFAGIEYERGWENSSFCTYRGNIFFFPKNNYSEVWCLDVAV